METMILRVAVDVAVMPNTSKDAGEHLLDAMYDIARRVCKRENLSLRCARLANLGKRPDLPVDEDACV